MPLSAKIVQFGMKQKSGRFYHNFILSSLYQISRQFILIIISLLNIFLGLFMGNKLFLAFNF